MAKEKILRTFDRKLFELGKLKRSCVRDLSSVWDFEVQLSTFLPFSLFSLYSFSSAVYYATKMGPDPKGMDGGHISISLFSPNVSSLVKQARKRPS